MSYESNLIETGWQDFLVRNNRLKYYNDKNNVYKYANIDIELIRFKIVILI